MTACDNCLVELPGERVGDGLLLCETCLDCLGGPSGARKPVNLAEFHARWDDRYAANGGGA